MFSASDKHISRRRQLLCALLCVCSWRGPVPMVHHHDQLAEQSVVRRSHLCVFHDDAWSDSCNDWHWHLVTPVSAPAENPEASETYLIQEFLSLACTASAIADQPSECFPAGVVRSADFGGCWTSLDTGSESLPTGHCPSFLASLSLSNPLVVLTGVSQV